MQASISSFIKDYGHVQGVDFKDTETETLVWQLENPKTTPTNTAVNHYGIESLLSRQAPGGKPETFASLRAIFTLAETGRSRSDLVSALRASLIIIAVTLAPEARRRATAFVASSGRASFS